MQYSGLTQQLLLIIIIAQLFCRNRLKHITYTDIYTDIHITIYGYTDIKIYQYTNKHITYNNMLNVALT
jgi:hypothetical protein